MKLLLIRHGETEWTVTKRYQGISDIPLNSEGIRQARKIARALRSYRPTRLYTSTLRRARQTVKEVAARFRLRAVADPRLNEIDFGKWEGVFYRQLAEDEGIEFRKWREGKIRKPPGGESVDSLSRRVNSFLKEILRRHPEETVAVISHGGPIKMFLFKVLKSEHSSIWSFRIDPASISLIEGDSSLQQITWTNRTDHLNSKP